MMVHNFGVFDFLNYQVNNVNYQAIEVNCAIFIMAGKFQGESVEMETKIYHADTNTTLQAIQTLLTWQSIELIQKIVIPTSSTR